MSGIEILPSYVGIIYNKPMKFQDPGTLNNQ